MEDLDSQSYDSSFSPWQKNFIDMAKKTVIKKALKYKRHICDNCLRRFKDIESLKKTDLKNAERRLFLTVQNGLPIRRL